MVAGCQPHRQPPDSSVGVDLTPDPSPHSERGREWAYIQSTVSITASVAVMRIGSLEYSTSDSNP